MSTLASVTDQLGAVKPKMYGITAEVWVQTKLAGVTCYEMFGYRNDGNEHPTGYAIDFMVGYPGHHDDGQAIFDYIWQHRERHGFKWMIWEQTYYSLITPQGRKMDDRGSPNQNHMNHVHAFFDNSPYTYLPKAPRYPVRTLRVGVKGGDVEALQRGLNAAFNFAGDNLVADGSFGAKTEAHVKAYQVLRKLTVDGIVGPNTRKSLTTTSGISL